MDTKLQENLEERFKFIDCFIECGDGWFEILWDMCLELEKELHHFHATEFKLIQIKEKFRQLRVYSNIFSLRTEIIVRNAEDSSKYICEKCGGSTKISKILKDVKMCNC